MKKKPHIPESETVFVKIARWLWSVFQLPIEILGYAIVFLSIAAIWKYSQVIWAFLTK